MSSSSSRPYQSKVFNFFNQYSRRLSQQLESTIRNLQVATKWSVEALLHPLYQVLQTNQLIEKRLQTSNQTTQTYLKSSTSPPADASIHNVLESIKNLPSAAASESETLQNMKSSGFFGRTWEKITDSITHSFDWLNNQSVPKLQPEKTLQHHIRNVQGIAVKLESRNLVLISENNQVLDVLTISQQRKLNDKINQEIGKYSHLLKLAAAQEEDNILPKINRLLDKLTNSSNFSITDVVENENTLKIEYYDPSRPNKILAVLDSTLAKLETKTIIPIKQQNQGILKSVKTQLEMFIYGNADNLEKGNLHIPALIEFAINYFFGVRKITQLREQERFYALPKETVSNHNQKSDLTADYWLTWGELFGNLEIIDNNDNKQEISTTEKTVIVQNQQTIEFENEREPKEQKHRLKPDWIEITATVIGYEKHPLEQILEWLDYIMLWIEVIFINMIYFFKGLLQG